MKPGPNPYVPLDFPLGPLSTDQNVWMGHVAAGVGGLTLESMRSMLSRLLLL